DIVLGRSVVTAVSALAMDALIFASTLDLFPSTAETNLWLTIFRHRRRHTAAPFSIDLILTLCECEVTMLWSGTLQQRGDAFIVNLGTFHEIAPAGVSVD